MMGFIAWIKNKIPSVGSVFFFHLLGKCNLFIIFGVITVYGHTAGVWMGTDRNFEK